MSVKKLYETVAWVADANGNALSRLAVHIDDCWYLLDPAKLQRGNCDELIQVASQCRIAMTVPHKGRRDLCDRILSAASGEMIWLEADGFQEIEAAGSVARAFVWRGKPHWVGDEPEMPYQVAPQVGGSVPPSRGTLRNWRKFSQTFRGNPYLIVGVGAALSALLAKPMHVDPLSLVLIGRSSIGKSAIQSALMSLIRPPNLKSAGGTVRGLHQILSEHPGQPVFIEDLRQQRDLDGLLGIFFDVGNRASRVVGRSWQSAGESRAMECTVIASNEMPLTDMLRGRSYEGGIEARVLQLEIAESQGAFHALPEGMTGAQFAQHLKTEAAHCYGVVWDEWVETVAENFEELRSEWAEQQSKIVASLAQLAGEDEDGLNGRVLRGIAFWKFCVMAAAEAELLGFGSKSINKGFSFVVKKHFAQRTKGLSRNDEMLVDRVRMFLRKNRDKFPALTPDAVSAGNAWGYRRRFQKLDTDVFLVYPTTLVEHVAAESGRRALVHALLQAGYLLPNKGRENQGDRVQKLGGNLSAKMFVITADILSE